MIDQDDYILHLLDIGASGYLLKNSSASEMETAIEEVVKKGFYFNHHISQVMLSGLKRKRKPPQSLDIVTRISARERKRKRSRSRRLTTTRGMRTTSTRRPRTTPATRGTASRWPRCRRRRRRRRSRRRRWRRLSRRPPRRNARRLGLASRSRARRSEES